MALLQLILFFQLVWLIDASFPPIAKSNCQDACGNVTVPYPFGIGLDCALQQTFNLTCNTTSSPPTLLWDNIPVLNISLSGETSLALDFSFQCFNKGGEEESNYHLDPRLMEYEPITFSITRNKFIAIGCDTMGYFQSKNFTAGCMSYCTDEGSITDGSCDGVGCCQTSIPKGVRSVGFSLSSFNNYTQLKGTNFTCSYAFFADADQFNFKKSDIFGTNFLVRRPKYPVVIDWAIDKNACRNCVSGGCYRSEAGFGYRCRCQAGHEGNPYLPHGCTDIDECKTGKHNCSQPAICNNLPGRFECKCPGGLTGDGVKGGSGCEPVTNRGMSRVEKFLTGMGSGLLFLLITGVPWLFWLHNKRTLMKLRRKFFKENGGKLLQQLVDSTNSTKKKVEVRIFTIEELEKATNNFHVSRIVGQGGYGTVYKGLPPDNKVAAIKKAKITDKNQIDQFINEIHVILHKMEHTNMVQLLGCCLETETPLLVYEFIPNGTLFHHIHDEENPSSLSWENRLRIAAETAAALAYLHSEQAGGIPIIHRDVKSANILLDNNLTAKVSDFGASRLAPLDATKVTTLVQGTLGYLDPEYFHTGQLSQKSDVYSFGVVLAELLTGEMPICPKRDEAKRGLSMYFLSALKEGRLSEVLSSILQENTGEQVLAVAELARRCLKLKGVDRPTMKEAETELQRVRSFQQHPWTEIKFTWSDISMSW